MRALAIALAGAAIGATIAGCGASARPSDTAIAAAASAARPDAAAVTTAGKRPPHRVEAAPPRPRLIRGAATAYGTALVDSRGFALYRFTHDTADVSTCYGACARAWPPYLVPAKLARGAANTRSAGTVRRADGRLQVTYAGHPLYHYVGDRRPAQVLCQGVTEFGGGWFVVAPSGRLIR
jgi:predicted lipoprotein with Yx(FWY)xxD motif